MMFIVLEGMPRFMARLIEEACLVDYNSFLNTYILEISNYTLKFILLYYILMIFLLDLRSSNYLLIQ